MKLVERYSSISTLAFISTSIDEMNFRDTDTIFAESRASQPTASSIREICIVAKGDILDVRVLPLVRKCEVAFVDVLYYWRASK